jgi:hypothetical protein
MVAYSIGSYLVQMPVRDRKSGIPLSVETPAPVRTTHGCASTISLARCSTEMHELYAKLAVGLVALAAAVAPRAGSAGVTVALPPGWHAAKPDRGRITQPLTRLVVSSGQIHPRLTGACHSQVADYTFPTSAVAIVVVEWTQSIGGMHIGSGPPRPKRFTSANLRIHRPEAIECFDGPGGSVQWAERGHSFAAYVLLGREAPPAAAAHARAVLDTLRVARR